MDVVGQSIRQWLVGQLIEHGLWTEEALTVVSGMAAKDTTGLRWGDPINAYPKATLAVLLRTAKSEAVKWIDANKPEHFARPILTGEL